MRCMPGSSSLQDRSARGIPLPDHAWKVGEYLDYWLENVARHGDPADHLCQV